MTREWAVELLKYNIRANAIVVAESWTSKYAGWIQEFPFAKEKLNEIISGMPPVNRMASPQEIANIAALLLSESSGHTTGQLIYADGSYVCPVSTL